MKNFFSKYAACNFIQKEILTEVVSCEFCKILRTPIFIKKPQAAAST